MVHSTIGRTRVLPPAHTSARYWDALPMTWVLLPTLGNSAQLCFDVRTVVLKVRLRGMELCPARVSRAAQPSLTTGIRSVNAQFLRLL